MNIEYKELFLKYLALLHQLIELVEVSDNSAELLKARLVDDMFGLNVQVKVATNFALRGGCSLSGINYKELDIDVESFQGIKAYIIGAITQLNTLDNGPLALSKTNICDTAGLTDISLPRSVYLSSFVLPNFFFHMSMVYAIAKCHGVAVTKGDFDGIHQYPKGFSWE